MKNLSWLIVAVIALSGCQQLLNGQQQPVKELSNQRYFTSCGGAVENWASCNNKAMSTCLKGYEILSKTEDSNGIKRELTFQCNK